MRGATCAASNVLPLAALALAACTSTAPPRAQIDREAVARYRDAGYPIPPPGSIEGRRISNPPSEAPWSISIARPADRALHAVIIYLPGLGEADNVPNRWIGVWARAGYAVLVVQPLADDADVWATPEARSGDFERVARARFGADLMADRLSSLAALIARIYLASTRGEAGLEGLDWSHLAFAGADLGAYTVQCIAAGAAAQPGSAPWPSSPLAYLAISPYVDRNAPVPAAALPPHAPVLMVSSRDDVDAYGVITDTSLRRAAFDRLGIGGDYYFELESATHRWLAGVVPSAGSGDAVVRHAASKPDDIARRRPPASARDAMAPEGDDDDPTSEKSEKNAARMAQIAQERSRALTRDALSQVSFEAITIAFLDAYVRQQAPARTWLIDAAPGWLQRGDRLKRR